MKDTLTAYREVVASCKTLFLKKAQDYGTAWAILRLPSVTDQIGIKADRIRSIQEKQVNKVGDSIEDEFVGIINYCVIALIISDLQKKGITQESVNQWDIATLTAHYQTQLNVVEQLMLNKNHDYGEAWRKMRIASMTDLILMKILRLKQIEDNAGKTLVSEGVDANYSDIMNYAIFCLILMKEAQFEDKE